MNTEQAISFFEGVVDGKETRNKYEAILVEASHITLSALREKAEREKGCEYCKDNGGKDLMKYVNYCPNCGRKLEPKEGLRSVKEKKPNSCDTCANCDIPSGITPCLTCADGSNWEEL